MSYDIRFTDYYPGLRFKLADAVKEICFKAGQRSEDPEKFTNDCLALHQTTYQKFNQKLKPKLFPSGEDAAEEE